MNQTPRDDIEDIKELMNKLVDVIEDADCSEDITFPALTRLVITACHAYDMPLQLFFEVTKEVERRRMNDLKKLRDSENGCQKKEFSE